jgi:hypothetical protein
VETKMTKRKLLTRQQIAERIYTLPEEKQLEAARLALELYGPFSLTGRLVIPKRFARLGRIYYVPLTSKYPTRAAWEELWESRRRRYTESARYQASLAAEDDEPAIEELPPPDETDEPDDE